MGKNFIKTSFSFVGAAPIKQQEAYRASFVAQRLGGTILFHKGQRRSSSTRTRTAVVVKPSIASKYYVPKAERDGKNCVFELDPIFNERLVKINRKCPSRELNYTPEMWERHKDPWRRIRHLASLSQSSPFNRLLLPDLTITASIAMSLSYYNAFLSPEAQLVMDGSAMAGATTAIGLLAAFRLNTSYARYEEARKFWGEINNSSRDLAGNALMWLETSKQKDRMLKLIKAFPVAMQFHLNEKGGHYRMLRRDPNFQEQKYAEFYAELNDIYKDEHHHDFVQLCNTYHNGGHVPLAVTSCMRVIISQNKEFGDPVYNRELDEQVQRLVGCLGMCERVLRTPIPTCFTRHTSRLSCFWSNLLPFAMYPALGPIGVVPGSLLVAYAVLGIGDVGVQLEEPFNILPLRQYSDGIYDGINSIEASFIRGNNPKF